MPLYTTARLTVRRLTEADAPFALDLLTEPAWIRYVGDRGVRTVADARHYLHTGPMASYAAYGHGLYRVALTATDEPIGICGLLRRDGLEHADLGYAFLEAYHGHGYATEAARATLEHARLDLGIDRVLAITTEANVASQRVLEKIGMHRAGTLLLAGDAEASLLYSTRPAGSPPDGVRPPSSATGRSLED
ncbi:MAG: GNAT family N-acetyltransferase [Bacteroidota bacterium]